MKAYFIIMGLLFSLPCQAAVYECVEGGKVVYTNKKNPNCKSATLQQIGSYTNTSKVYKQTHSTVVTTAKMTPDVVASPNRQVRVDTEIQQKRDQGRVQVLRSELDNERKALEEAEKQLAESRVIKNGQNPQERQEKIKNLESIVLDRKENIRALQQEIVRM